MNYARVTETDSHLVNPTVKSPRRQVRRSYGRSPDRKRDFGDSCKYPARSRFSPRRKEDNIGSEFFQNSISFSSQRNNEDRNEYLYA